MENRFFLSLTESDACNEQYCPDRSLAAVREGGMLTPGLGGILVVDSLQATHAVHGPMSPHGSMVCSPSTATPAGSWLGAEPGWGLEPHPKQLLSEHPKFWKGCVDLGS